MNNHSNMHSPEQSSQTGHCEKHGDYEIRYIRDIPLKYCQACQNERIEADQAQRKAERKARDDELHAMHLADLRDKSGIPHRFENRTFKNYVVSNQDQQRALDFAQQYAGQFDDAYNTGQSALLVGRLGTGKTHLACAIGNQLLDQGRSVIYTTVSWAMRRIKSTWGGNTKRTEYEVICDYINADLLILDEIGVQFGSDTERNLLFDILNGRYECRLPTLFLSNHGRDEVVAYLGERVFDRIREDGGQMIVFNWDSARGKDYVPPVSSAGPGQSTSSAG